jgi:transcriptional regulator with XRE-family HTH domain
LAASTVGCVVWGSRLPALALMPESLGRRVAALRMKLGWTQQELADRLAVSRVAVSHLEAGMTDPGERTVALLAGLFKVEPHELVADTSYPVAKAERLPVVVPRWTEVEHQLELLENDLAWLERPGGAESEGLVLEQWDVRLAALAETAHDRSEREAVEEARRRLRARPRPKR